jgi:hypothetical protein
VLNLKAPRNRSAQALLLVSDACLLLIDESGRGRVKGLSWTHHRSSFLQLETLNATHRADLRLFGQVQKVGWVRWGLQSSSKRKRGTA